MSEQFNHNDPEFMRFMRQSSQGGARRFAGIAGVSYPKADTARVGSTKKNPLQKLPRWPFVTTREAAEMLHSSASSTRAVLNRHKVRFCFSIKVCDGKAKCWNKKEVQEIADHRSEIVSSIPKKFCDSVEALEILGVGRATLYRYVQSGKLHEKQVRMMTKSGTRQKSLYLRSECKKVAAVMRVIRAKYEDFTLAYKGLNKKRNHGKH